MAIGNVSLMLNKLSIYKGSIIKDIPNSSNLFNFVLYANDTIQHCCFEDINSENT